jgi:histidyl-tRNA synthetase
MIFADSSSGLGTLGFSTSAFIIQLITFVLAFWVIKKFAVTPIVKMLNERRKAIEDGVSLGEKLRKEALDMEEKVSKELSAARHKADEIIDEAKETARSAVKAGEEDAVKKADEIFNNLMDKFGDISWDDNGNIGKRYRRQDEIGTPYCITVDFDSLEDDSVTVRDRNTTEQKRVKISDLDNLFHKNLII